MNRRSLAVVVAVLVATVAWAASAVFASSSASSGRGHLRAEGVVPANFTPASKLAQQTGRYFVTLDTPAVADRVKASARPLSGREQSKIAATARASQSAAIGQARSLGGAVNYRYDTLINGFSASISTDAARELAQRSDVRSVEPVSISVKTNETAVPFIGAPKVYKKFKTKGEGIKVAVVDDGIDYTHKNFGGPGTVSAYESNDPNVIEDKPNGKRTFPTAKVPGGYDFVGSGYDVLDEDTSNDTPHPDFDPLDDGGGHGSHTAGSCCGNGVPGKIGAGVAPKAKIYSYKVWSGGSTPGGGGDSTDDVLVAAYERAVDPNQDGNTRDRADVLSFSGGVDYGTLNSTEARAAQRVVDLGTVFVASAGNSSNQGVGAAGYIVGTPAAARGVVAVAASIDQYSAQTLSVNAPSGLSLPDNGIMVEQDFGGEIPGGGLTGDLYDTRAEDPPSSPGNEAPSDAQLCDPVAGNPYAGKIVLGFKGSTGAGDCGGSQKVFNAQQAGADGVILISLFGGFPSALSAGGEAITIPAVMITANDGYALLDELSPSASYNSGAVNATLESETTAIPGFEDSLTDFTSEGPARITSDLKPDIAAPGFDILSTAAGTGDEGVKLSGTSMSAPMVSGVAALLRQIHPKWDPSRIKAVMMNQATRKVKNNDLSSPAPATVMGAGRVQADEAAKAVTVAEPASLSYGLNELVRSRSTYRHFKVTNTDSKDHTYAVSANVRYTDFDPALTDVLVSANGRSYGATQTFKVKKHKAKKIYVRLTADPDAITEADQENGLYAFNGTADGTVKVKQKGKKPDTIDVAWQTTPLAASLNSLADDSLDLSGGPATTTLNSGTGSAIDYADLYELGDQSDLSTRGEADIVATGARSFTGSSVEDDTAEGVPGGLDEFGELGWQDFLTNDDVPSELVEFGVQDAAIHNTSETLQTDVLVDAGADGVFADPDLKADYLVTKPAGSATGGVVCVYDLSDADPLDECDATYFQDYSVYNTNITGLAVDATAIGMTDAEPTLSYSVSQCTDSFSGDVPTPICDTAGAIDEGSGTYDATLNTTDPALSIDPLVCKGFWDGGDCDSGSPITVATGSAAPGDNPSILALFPNNQPSRRPTIISTDDGS
ncbi:S8 family serine peptidase [soil metagenome]